MRRSVSGVVPLLVHLAVWSAALAALVLVPSCSAAPPLTVPSPSLVEVPHERSQFSNQWRSLGRAHPAQRVKLLVALKQRNIELLESIALKISDPMHPSYGRHLSIEQVANLIAPMQDDVEKTLRWLDEAGIDDKQRTLTNGRDWIKISTTVDMAEELLQAQFHVFEHKTTRKQLVRLEGSYFLPAHVAEVIDFIGGVHGFPSSHTKQPRGVKVARDPESQPSVTPSIANTRYNVTMQPIKGTNNSQGVAEFAEDFYSPPDLQTFFAQFDPVLKGQVIVDVFGANNFSEGVSLEANLDVQYIMALAPFAPTYFYSYNYPDTDIMLEFLEWVVDLSNDPKPPLVHSVSYGEYGGVYTLRQVYRISAQWMILGTRGVTVFFASGDDGVGCNDAGTQFAFPYPSSPWITMVGSTRLNLNNGRYNETGSDFSSGGFSGDFFRPDWQENAVKYYLSHAPLPPASYWAFNRSGRAMPDVAALGENVQIVEEGQVQGVDGTSCSSPIFAGLVSQLNAVRLSKGKSPLGFINPLLYKTAAQRSDAFYDVTVGYNDDDPCPGFTAFRGWDPVTGLGTPNFKVLLEVVQQLP